VFVDANTTANYTSQWLLGAVRQHRLEIDDVGLWNERTPPAAYAKALRDTVRAAGLGAKTTVVGKWPIDHYGRTGVAEDPPNTQHPWQPDNENASRWMDEEGSVNDGRLARCLARCEKINENKLKTLTSVAAPAARPPHDPVAPCLLLLRLPPLGPLRAVANTPWSGGYEVTSATWALAHTTQFAPIGWRYTRHFAGVQMLAGGGSIVTRVSPDGNDSSRRCGRPPAAAPGATTRGCPRTPST